MVFTWALLAAVACALLATPENARASGACGHFGRPAIASDPLPHALRVFAIQFRQQPAAMTSAASFKRRASEHRSARQAVERSQRGGARRADARDVQARQLEHAGRPLCLRPRDQGDPRRRAARRVVAARDVLLPFRQRRTEPGQHLWRSTGLAVRGWLAAGLDPDGPAAWRSRIPAHAGPPDLRRRTRCDGRDRLREPARPPRDRGDGADARRPDRLRAGAPAAA